MKKQVVYILILAILIVGIILVSSVNLDLNHDGVVNITDLQILAAHFEGKAAYNSTFDLNGNGKVDLFDVVKVARDVNTSTKIVINGSAPTYNSTVDKMVFSDNMDEYTNPATMGSGGGPSFAAWSGPYTTGTNVTPGTELTVGMGGTGKALRMAYTGVWGSTPSYLTINTGANVSGTSYVSYWARMNGNNSDPSICFAVKWIEFWHGDPQNTRIQFNTHWPSANNPLQTEHYSNSSSPNCVWQVCDGGCPLSTYADQPFRPYPIQLWDNQWHLYTYMWKPSTGNNDAVARMWIDGKLIIDDSYATINVTPDGGNKPWCTNESFGQLSAWGTEAIALGNFQSTNPGVNWTLDIDDFKWWTNK